MGRIRALRHLSSTFTDLTWSGFPDKDENKFDNSRGIKNMDFMLFTFLALDP